MRTTLASLCCLAALAICPSGHALDLEGYAEPYRTVHVAFDETGTIDRMFVREGEVVAPGQPLAQLNSDIHRALLAVAEQHMRSTGRLDAATANLQLRTQRLEQLRILRGEGHARQEEVDRAQSEAAVARANVQAAQEDLLAKRLECEKIKTQIARRTVRAPIGGVVSGLHKDRGEFVAPNSPDLLTLVQIDTLLANFTLLEDQVTSLTLEQEIEVHFFGCQQSAIGHVELISPVTDAESGTVLVKIRVANPERRFRSGQRCKIRIKDGLR